MDCLLGIDCGGTAAKVALFDLDGTMIATASQRIAVSLPKPGHAERDAEAMWTQAAGAIRDLLARSGVAAGRIAAIAATGHGNGLYLVDSEGACVRPGINSTDTRAAAIVEATIKSGVHAVVRRRSLQNLWPGQPEMLLAWLRRHEPESLTRARAVLLCKDFIRLRLTGRTSLELTDLATTNLCDVRSGTLDGDLLECFGLADLAPLFGDVVTSETICGTVTPEAARATGLVAGTPVAAGCIDIVASALGSGCIEPTQMAVIAGTWSINERIAPAPIDSDDIFMVGRFVGRHQFLIVEASACSAGNLEWFLDTLLDDGAGSRAHAYETCNALVAAVPLDDEPILFLPYLNGSRDTGFARGTLVGVTAFHKRGHVLRAVYEGVAFEHRAHIERLLRHGEPPTIARLTGGAARSKVWAQIFADVCALPIELPACEETGAMGAAICAAVGVGAHRSYADAVRRMVRVAARHDPDPARSAIYERRYRQHRALASALAPYWPTVQA